MRNRCKVLKEVYKVDETKKTIVCILTFDMQLLKSSTTLVYPTAFISEKEDVSYGKAGVYTVVGISKCHPDDTFDVIKGKRIAQSRAKLEMYRKATVTWDSIYRNLLINVADIRNRRYNCMVSAKEEKAHIKDLDK